MTEDAKLVRFDRRRDRYELWTLQKPEEMRPWGVDEIGDVPAGSTVRAGGA